jgi:TonB family protein
MGTGTETPTTTGGDGDRDAAAGATGPAGAGGPVGGPELASGVGAGGPGAGRGAGPDPTIAYAASLRDRIARRLRASSFAAEGARVVVLLDVDPGGAARVVRTEAPDPALAAAVERAIAAAQPFPPPPSGAALRVWVPVVFRSR